ncbi:MAG TPA: TfuA-like protein [Hyalangium sp.]|nr:TfuA-like protein [Hyalangium sp.]
MSLIVFCGPSLSHAEGRTVLDAVFLPPAQQGDVYRAAREKPTAIGLIDGLFDQVNSVAHKEILWAMSQGVHVLGSASMGALRAVELAPFGMEGIGTIFEWYQTGLLEDDDEVALLHGPPEDGYVPLSEPMVNLRATLTAAESQGVISSALQGVLLTLVKETFYADRSYPLMLARALERGVGTGELDGLREFIRTRKVNQKRQDALRLLEVMRDRFSAGVEPKKVRYHFSLTDAWQAIRDRVDTALISER